MEMWKHYRLYYDQLLVGRMRDGCIGMLSFLLRSVVSWLDEDGGIKMLPSLLQSVISRLDER